MNTVIVVFLASVLADIGSAEIRSKGFVSLGVVDGDGENYHGQVYDHDLSCSRQCRNEECDQFAVAEADGGGVHCIFDVARNHLPHGRWNIYAKSGKVCFNLAIVFVSNRII